MPAALKWYINVVPEADGNALIHDLYRWGPALASQIKAQYPAAVVRELVQGRVITLKKFTGFEAYLLTGVGLRPYGYSMRYNYVPSRKVVLGSLMLRQTFRRYETDGYECELFDGYTQHGRDNLFLARREGQISLVIVRASLTSKSLRDIIHGVKAQVPDLSDVQVTILKQDAEERVLGAETVLDYPLKVTTLALSAVTGEQFKAKRTYRKSPGVTYGRPKLPTKSIKE